MKQLLTITVAAVLSTGLFMFAAFVAIYPVHLQVGVPS